MSNLLKIQQDFYRHIYKESDQKILKQTIYSDIEALERFSIYRNNILGSFESVLPSTFPITKKIIGDKEFDKLTQKFCQKFYSKSGDLNEFGTEFPQFLKSHKHLYLKDLAQLELFYHQSYFSNKSEEKFGLKKFKKLQPESFSKVKFTLNSGSVLFNSKFAIISIWQKERKIRNFSEAQFALIHSNKIFPLNETEFLFLSLISKKKSLFKIYEEICKKTKKDVNIGEMINRFVSDGTIIKFDL